MAIDVQALSERVWMAGSSGMWAGRGTVAGRSVGAALMARLNFFFLGAAALLPRFSRIPPSIHRLRIARSSSGIGGESGGIFGSSSWVTSR